MSAVRLPSALTSGVCALRVLHFFEHHPSLPRPDDPLLFLLSPKFPGARAFPPRLCTVGLSASANSMPSSLSLCPPPPLWVSWSVLCGNSQTLRSRDELQTLRPPCFIYFVYSHSVSLLLSYCTHNSVIVFNIAFFPYTWLSSRLEAASPGGRHVVETPEIFVEGDGKRP